MLGWADAMRQDVAKDVESDDGAAAFIPSVAVAALADAHQSDPRPVAPRCVCARHASPYLTR